MRLPHFNLHRRLMLAAFAVLASFAHANDTPLRGQPVTCKAGEHKVYVAYKEDNGGFARSVTCLRIGAETSEKGILALEALIRDKTRGGATIISIIPLTE